MIRFSEVSYRYKGEEKFAIDTVSFQIKRGQWVALIGPNGSGKSTLVHLLVGTRKRAGGQIVVCGYDPQNEGERPKLLERVGLVLQQPENQIVGATVLDDVAFGLENRGYPLAEMEKRVRRSLEQVGLWPYRHLSPHHLSGGQKQRLAIASALAHDAEILILDEAFSMLDPQGKKEVRTLLRELNRQGMTILSITHDMDEAWETDHVLFLAQGRLIAQGPPREVLRDAALLNRHGLMPPFVVEATLFLKDEGLSLAGWPDTLTELVEAIWLSLPKD